MSPTSTLRGAPHPSGSAKTPPPLRSHPFHAKEVSLPPLFLLPSRCLEQGSHFVIIYSIAHLQLPSQCTFSCVLRWRGVQIELVSFITISPAPSQAQRCAQYWSVDGWRRKEGMEGGRELWSFTSALCYPRTKGYLAGKENFLEHAFLYHLFQNKLLTLAT